jgi:hypothetical protein
MKQLQISISFKGRKKEFLADLLSTIAEEGVFL